MVGLVFLGEKHNDYEKYWMSKKLTFRMLSTIKEDYYDKLYRQTATI